MKSLTTAEKIEYLWQSNAPLTASLAGVLQHYSGYKPPCDNATSNISGDHGFTSALSEYSRRRKKLDALPPAEIDLLYAFARNVELNTEELQRPYNQAHAQADFSHWARFSRWTVDETVALLFGKNPKIVKERYLEKFKYDDELAELERESLKIMSLAATGKRGFSRQYKELVALVERSEIFLPGTQDVDPVSALSWARHTGISIPAALAAAFVGKNARTVTWRTRATESNVDIPAASIRAATEHQAAPVMPVMPESASGGVEPGKAGPLPLTTGDIAFCFAGLRWNEQEWKKPLGDKPDWLAACIAIPGVRGGSARRWNPVLIGAALVHNGHAKQNSIRARFQIQPQLVPWFDAWKTYEADNLSA